MLNFFLQQIMMQIKNSRALLKTVMQKLVEQLVNWLIRQKEVSCGPRATIKKHYDLLDGMDQQFEECGRQISFLINIMDQLHNIIDSSTPEIFSKFQRYRSELIQNARHFVWQSLIIAVQPPVVLIKCRGSDSYRSTRFPCKTEVRLLGGEALGVRTQASLVKVEIISEEIARKIQQDPCQPAISEPTFHLIYNDSRFQIDSPQPPSVVPVCRASFDKIVS